jgi:hypothetical protein
MEKYTHMVNGLVSGAAAGGACVLLVGFTVQAFIASILFDVAIVSGCFQHDSTEKEQN